MIDLSSLSITELEQILLEFDEFDEKPVDIETFITDPYYLGDNFPNGFRKYWMKVFKEIYPSPVIAPYSIIFLKGSIGRGKTTTVCIGMLYDIYLLLCRTSPQSYLGLTPKTKILFALFSISLSLADDVISEILTGLMSSSPYFKEVLTKAKNNKVGSIFTKGVDFFIGSKIVHSLGKAVYSCILDESSFSKSSTQVYDNFNSLLRRMQSRSVAASSGVFGMAGKAWVVSSESAKNSTLNKMLEKYIGKPGVYVDGGNLSNSALWHVVPEKYNKGRFQVFIGTESIPPRIIDFDQESDRLIQNYKDMIIEVPEEHFDDFEIDINKCFVGETKLDLLDGTSISFEELYKEDRKDIWVYSCEQNGRLVPGHGHSCIITKYVKTLVEIEFDNGYKERCTVSHPFMLRNGEYKEAQFLSPDESLMPLYKRITENGYEQIKDNKTGRWRKTYEVVSENIAINTREDVKLEGNRWVVVHHNNWDKTNNSPDNLLFIGDVDHFHLHKGNIRKNIWDRPEMVQMMKNKWDDLDYRDKMRITSKETMSKLWSDPEFYEMMVEVGKDQGMKNSSFINNDESRRKSLCSRKIAFENEEGWTIEAKKMFSESITKYNKSQEHRDKASVSGKLFGCKNLQNAKDNPNFKYNNRKGIYLGYLEEVVKRTGSLNRDIYNTNKKKHQCSWETLISFFGSEEEMILQHKNKFNHRIKSVNIVTLDTPVPVYDITVDKYHNFALSAGVFVHNSLQDLAGVGTVSTYKLFKLRERLNNLFSITPLFPDTIVLDFDDDKQVWDHLLFPSYFDSETLFKGMNRHIHIDVGLTGDSLGIACSSVFDFRRVDIYKKDVFEKVQEFAPVTATEWAIAIRPTEGKQIPLFKIRNFINYIAGKGIFIRTISADTFQSADLLQIMKANGFTTEILSVDRTPIPYFTLRDQTYRLHHFYPKSELLKKEMNELEVVDGKVDHPYDGSKDVADAVCGSTIMALKYSEEVKINFTSPSGELNREIADMFWG